MDETTPYQIELNGQTIRVHVTDGVNTTGTQNGGWHEAADWKCRRSLSRLKVEAFLRGRGFTETQIVKLNTLYNPLAARAVAIHLNGGDHTAFLSTPLGF